MTDIKPPVDSIDYHRSVLGHVISDFKRTGKNFIEINFVCSCGKKWFEKVPVKLESTKTIEDYMKTAVFDFDGVLATYKGWKGFDVLGEPQMAVISCIKELKYLGWRIVIWTTRPATPTLIKWLEDNDVPFDDVNRNGHNPLSTSGKPIYHVIVDDRAVRYKGQTATELMDDIMGVVHDNAGD